MQALSACSISIGSTSSALRMPQPCAEACPTRSQLFALGLSAFECRISPDGSSSWWWMGVSFKSGRKPCHHMYATLPSSKLLSAHNSRCSHHGLSDMCTAQNTVWLHNCHWPAVQHTRHMLSTHGESMQHESIQALYIYLLAEFPPGGGKCSESGCAEGKDQEIGSG